MSSYATLKVGCTYEPYAITSNQKFLSPLNNIYYKSYNNMLLYPNSANFVYQPINNIINPEDLKAIKSNIFRQERIPFKYTKNKDYKNYNKDDKETTCNNCKNK